jgi:hypothetical protein
MDKQKLKEMRELVVELRETLGVVQLAVEVVNKAYSAAEELHELLPRVETHPNMIRLVPVADQTFAGVKDAFINMIQAAKITRQLSDRYVALLTGVIEDAVKEGGK